MLVDKFKQGKDVDLIKAIEKYVSKHYGIFYNNQENVKFSKIEPFIKFVATTRSMATNLNSLEKSFESMKTYKEQLVIYISMINILRSKFNFGNDQYSIRIDLGWRDVLSNEYYYSNNIYHEYYSVMFNLAVMYFSIGKYENHGDEAKIKEQIKYFQHAAYIFEKIKQEVPAVIPLKEIQPDLNVDYLTYAGYISIANSQILIYDIACKKGLAFELQAQLAKGIYEIFTLAHTLAKETLKKLITDDVKVILNNRRFYYLCCSYLKMKDSNEDNFKQKGEGFGKMIAYTKLALESLQEGEKEIIKAKNIININEYMEFKSYVENILKDMTYKNQNIYYESLPDAKLLPRVDKLIKANPLSPTDDFNKFIEGQNSLDDMVPKEVKNMVDNYKQSISNFINSYLIKNENEETITQFLNSLNLPTGLEAILTMNDIPDSLWNRILDVHRRGGAMFLTSTFATLEQKNEEISKRMYQLEKALYEESQEDEKYRNMYNIKRWSRRESKELNYAFYQQIYDYRQKLTQAKSCDNILKESVINNMKYFEFLNLSKDQLIHKLPVKSDVILSIKDCQEAKELSSELDIMNSLKDKLNEVITKVFQNVNEENITPLMIKVLQKRTTEQAIIAESKSKYELYLKQLEEINTQIAESKKRIIEKNEKFVKIKVSAFKVCEPNEKFFADIESYIQLFNQKCAAITQGLNFYSEFTLRMNQLSQRINDFLMARDIEKNEMLRLITGQTYITTNYLNNPLLNPNTNTVTNIDYQYTYQPVKHGNQYSGQGHHYGGLGNYWPSKPN